MIMLLYLIYIYIYFFFLSYSKDVCKSIKVINANARLSLTICSFVVLNERQCRLFIKKLNHAIYMHSSEWICFKHGLPSSKRFNYNSIRYLCMIFIYVQISDYVSYSFQWKYACQVNQNVTNVVNNIPSYEVISYNSLS